MAATCFCCRFPCPYPDVLCAAGASALIGRNLRIFWTLARWFTSFDGASLLLLTGFSVVILEGAVSSLGGFGSASDNRRGKKKQWMDVQWWTSLDQTTEFLRFCAEEVPKELQELRLFIARLTKFDHKNENYIHWSNCIKGKQNHLIWN